MRTKVNHHYESHHIYAIFASLISDNINLNYSDKETLIFNFSDLIITIRQSNRPKSNEALIRFINFVNIQAQHLAKHLNTYHLCQADRQLFLGLINTLINSPRNWDGIISSANNILRDLNGLLADELSKKSLQSRL